MVDGSKLDAIRKAIATKGVRVRATNSKKKLPKPESINGRTNATNPKSITDLQEAFNALRAARNVKQWDVPNEPQPNKIHIEEHYERIGEAVGTCPYELRRIMESDITSGNELVISAFKKLLAAIKISTEVDLREIRRALKANDEHNATRHHHWEEAVERSKAHNHQCELDIEAKKNDFYQAWGNILIDLVQKTSVNPKMDSLGDWDRFMCYAIANTGETLHEYAKVKNDCISIDFNKAKAMPVDMVVNLPTLAARYQEQEKEAKFAEWLEKAPISNLMDALTDPHFDKEHDAISHAVAARKGLYAQRDRYGNLQWFDPQSYTLSYEHHDDDADWIDEDSVRETFIEYLNSVDRSRRYRNGRDRF